MRSLYTTIQFIGILVVLCFFPALHSCAQQFNSGFKKYGIAESLPNSSSNKVFESTDHFLWLSTQSGLFRFDGFQFSPYFSNSRDSNSLSSNVLSDIEEDRFGNLWVGTVGRGVNKLDRKTGQWKQYLHPSKDDNPFYWVFDIFKDAAGRLWIGTNGRGLLLYDEKTDQFQQYIPDITKNTRGGARFENEVRAIVADNTDANILWLAGTDGLYRFDSRTHQFTGYKYWKNGNADWINNSFHCIYQQDNNTIWLGAWGGGLVQFDIQKKSFTNYLPYPKEYTKQSFAHNIIAGIGRNNDSSLYISSVDGGLFEFNLYSKAFSVCKEVENKPTAFAAITNSSDGSTWFCSTDFIYQKHPVYNRLRNFQNFYQPAGKFVYPPGLSDVLYRPQTNTYWMSCNAGYGIYVFDSTMRYRNSIPIQGNEVDRRLRDIATDAKGNVFLLSMDAPYLYRYDSSKNVFVDAANDFKHLPFIQSGIKGMTADKKGTIWFVNKSKLYKWDTDQQRLMDFSLKQSKENQEQFLWAKLRFDHANEPWLATNMGLYHYEFAKQVWENIAAANDNKYNLVNRSITDIAFDKKGDCWIAPTDEGLALYDRKQQLFSQYFIQSEGFIAQRVNEVVTDSRGDIWLTSINGLAKYDMQTKQWFSFNQDDGLPITNLDQSFFALANGRMILSVANGFVFWDVQSLPINRQQPIVYFNHFISGGKSVQAALDEIQLPSSANELTIDFSAIVPVMGNRTKFYYKMLPLQNEWQYTSQRSITLAGFSAGKYQLLIKAVNADGIESEVKALTIQVAFPFWKTLWFMALCIVVIIGILYLIYQYRVRQLLRVQQLRNNISRDLHDEIGASVSSVNMLSLVAKKQLGDKHPVTPLLTQIGQSAQRAGESITEIIWSINPTNDSIERIVLHAKEYTAELLEYNGIAYQLNVDIPFTQIKIAMQDRRHLFLIIKEALNNLIKYAQCTKVDLTMRVEGHTLMVVIEDNGIGFDSNNIPAGNGLVNMRQRAIEMKGNLIIESSMGKGCRIQLQCPIK